MGDPDPAITPVPTNIVNTGIVNTHIFLVYTFADKGNNILTGLCC